LKRKIESEVTVAFVIEARYLSHSTATIINSVRKHFIEWLVMTLSPVLVSADFESFEAKLSRDCESEKLSHE
jgi:hypothetical protein